MKNETVVPIFNQLGIVIDELKINDSLYYVDGRISKGERLYYKGVGVPYSLHHIDVNNINEDYIFLGDSSVFYAGCEVQKKCFLYKFGIFQEKYQIFFPDFIGSCSVKEGLIVLNSSIFEKSSVDVIDCIEFDKENKQYYYIINYLCERKKYLTDNGNPKKLKELIDYTIITDWNFLWDKNTIADITNEGLVSDLADMFKSDELKHKIGSVYSVLYSLGKNNFYKYLEFIKLYNLDHKNDSYYVFNTLKILEDNNVDVRELFSVENHNFYKNIVLNYLIVGKNCAHCACDMFSEEGERVKDLYVKRITNQFV